MTVILKKRILFLTALISFCLAAKAQDVNTLITNYGDKYSPERAYLHYDKSNYAAGETIWFKVYMMNGFLPADDTKNIYIDWIDDKGTPFLHAVAPLVDGITSGQFDIPVDYKGKSIHVRAYTRWMLNFDTSFFYNKDIRILSEQDVAGKDKQTVLPTLTLFPEGGDAIAGLKNKIAFKANDQWGRPVKIKGVVINSKGHVEDSLRVMHDGMGYFYITPEAGNTYTAKWKDEKGVEHNTALPDIKSMGATLQVTVDGSKREFLVNVSPGITSTIDSVHLVGTMYQHPVFNIAKSTSNLNIKGIVPTENLPTGILTITLFDNKWNPIAERITYIKNEDYLFTPQMEVQHWGLSKRAKNEIKITVPDSIVSSLSVSVTDIAIGGDSSTNIISHLLLSSELKGDVFNSAYYFSDRSNSTDQNLDLVMLTHGWRRFNWESVLKNKPVKFLYAKDTSYLSLSGTVAGAGFIAPDASIVLMMKQKDKPGEVLLAKVNSDGTFNDPSTIFFDTATVYYQFQKKEMKDASAQFLTNRLSMYPINNFKKGPGLWTDTSGNYRQWYLADAANGFAKLEKVKTLDAVILKSKSKSPVEIMDEKYASGLFSGGDSYQFDMINDPFASSSTSIFNYLQGKVAGLQISNSSTGSAPTLQWRGGTPQIFLDEVPVDADFISSMSVNDIAYVKVFRPPFFGASGGGANGAIAIYSRKGGDIKSAPGKGLAKNKVYGYTPIRQFYSPNYDKFDAANSKDDIRTTLYWNPYVITSPQQPQAVISFFNNDITKAFRVVIEGMTKDGRLAHVEQTME